MKWLSNHYHKLSGIVLLLLASSWTTTAQDYSSFTRAWQRLYASHPDSVERAWKHLQTTQRIPLVHLDSVVFFYRGKASSVAWMGDFNGWGYQSSFPNKGSRINQTDIWILRTRFPRDARIDYKIVVDGNHYLLDPENPHQQWSGVGGGSPNSELRMPDYRREKIAELQPGVKQGRVLNDLLFQSKHLGYQVMYSVYLPQGYQQHVSYPVMFVTDGYEYMHERMGNMTTILDNLIHARQIKPIVVVFIDHREPVNRSNNRRMTELAMQQSFLSFVADELRPSIEKQFNVSKSAGQRAIAGTSMGGLTAAYFAFSRPEIFGLAAIQSPAFWFKPEIYSLCNNPENPPQKIFMSTGLVNDTHEGAQKMKTILDATTCQYEYREVNQGHSWGNWRELIDDILIYFFPATD